MKDLKDMLLESIHFDENNKNHRDAWNKLIKWYDQVIKHMTADEVIPLLQKAIDSINKYDFNEIR